MESMATTCPACGYHVAVLFYDGGAQPLATLGWPKTVEEAQAMTRLPLRFVSCVDCGHVFNAAFDYKQVPYSDKPNLMFNRGARWSKFLEELRHKVLDRLPEHPVVVEIGHGEAHFLEGLAEARPEGRYIGFDPHGATEGPHASVELRQSLFFPEEHIARLRPDLIISRHVLEHLADPLGFVQNLAFAATAAKLRPMLYLEVPCIDRALRTGRIEDFYYEHNSHFTTESFSRMLARSFTAIDALDHGYNGEVVYAFLRLKGRLEHLDHAREAVAFRDVAESAKRVIAMQLQDLSMSGKNVAIWGGTGKGAAFMHAHNVDATRFPLVVDSDSSKSGTFVPGTGQKIQFRDVLLSRPVDVVLIPSQWRARDIVEEMRRSGICAVSVLLPHGGRLVDYFRFEHPYGAGEEVAIPGGSSALPS